MAEIKRVASEMVRINSRIGKNVNEWLDNESAFTGVPKSTLVHLALEQYIMQKQAVASMRDMTTLLEGISQGFDRFENKLNEIANK